MWSLLLLSLYAQSSSMWSLTSNACKQKGIQLVSVLTKHNEPLCIAGYVVAAEQGKDMVIAECSVK